MTHCSYYDMVSICLCPEIQTNHFELFFTSLNLKHGKQIQDSLNISNFSVVGPSSLTRVVVLCGTYFNIFDQYILDVLLLHVPYLLVDFYLVGNPKLINAL